MKIDNILMLGLGLMNLSSGMIAQSDALLFLRGSLPATSINPAMPLNKKVNISIIGIDGFWGTDGLSIDEITSRNAAGHRYIAIKDPNKTTKAENNIYGGLDVQTLGVSFGFEDFTLMAGHAFRSNANIKYPGTLIALLARGNTPFIGQTLDIGTSANYMGYNEVFLGSQIKAGNIHVGVKGKLLFGTNCLYTERGLVSFTTGSEIYQWELETDYIARSNGVLSFQSLDSVSLALKTISFDNLFLNNKGFSFDLGMTWQLGDKWLFMAGVTDLGKISWDLDSKKYSSKGKFVFEGIDVIDLLGDDKNISISDTLIDIIQVKTDTEKFNTTLHSRFHIGSSFDLNKRLAFNFLYSIQERFGTLSNQVSLSALLKFSILHTGITYTVTNNDFTSLGLFGRLKAGPFSLFIHCKNIFGIARPLQSKNAGIGIGTTLQF